MSSRRVTLAIAGAVAVAGLWAYVARTPSSTVGPVTAATVRTEPLQCRFQSGERAAYAFESSAVLDGAPGTGAAADRFDGVLNWVVVEGNRAGRPALLRASLGSVQLVQTLSDERVRAAEVSDGPFYVKIDTSCRFAGFGFSPEWSAAARRLVTSLLRAGEVVLPTDGSTTWKADQVDDVAAYTARYSLRPESGSGLLIFRDKPRYRLDAAARSLGVRVQLLGAEAEARFAPERPAWMRAVEGQERIRFLFPGQAPEGFIHRFRLARDDARFVAVSDTLPLAQADFAEVRVAGPASPLAADPAIAALSHEAARDRFLAFFRAHDGKPRGAVYPAARFLASWLRAHPGDTALLLADLRSGAIDEVAHSALFLALQLAGTDASRQVLADALTDGRLAELDRARAATALADDGAPSRLVAQLLLRQASASDSSMVASVSLLGAGSMEGHTDPGDPLRAELQKDLSDRLARASGGGEVTVVDALGNSGDDTFGPALDQRLRGGSATLRAHAAEALGHLSSEVAQPLLLARLQDESDPGVGAAILRSLGRLQATSGAALTPAEEALAARTLATSPSVAERAAAIDWLGSAGGQADARRVLAEHFPREPDVHLQQRIGTFVPVGELRAWR